jgi:hypothetical protein
MANEAVMAAARVAWAGIRLAVAASQIPEERELTTAYYLMVTICNLKLVDVAKLIGCSKQNLSKAVRQVEERREDAEFDAMIGDLEQQFLGERAWL